MEIFRFSTRVVFRLVSEIIKHEALKQTPNAADLSEHQRNQRYSEYAWSKTGRSFDQLLADSAEYVIRSISHSKDSYLDAMAIRHTCANALAVFVGAKHLRDAGETFVPRDKPQEIPPMLLAEMRDILAECKRETTLIESGARGEKVHLRLKPDDLEFIRSTRVRMMGFDERGNPLPSLEPDFATFRELEQHLLRWQEPLKAPVRHRTLLNEQQQRAVDAFYEEGGHSSAFTDKQIEFIRTHGLVLFIEHQTREGLSVPLGSISVLSRTPSSGENVDLDPRAWQHSDAVLKLFPQYDFEDLLPDKTPDAFRHSLRSSVANRILICRSSIRSTIAPAELGRPGEDPLSLRRLGLASALKFHALKISQLMGSKHLTFNIGTILSANDGELRVVNKPSREHNSWANVLAWRNYFSQLADGILMRWTAYEGQIADGLEEISRPNGLMAGKGWDMDGALAGAIRSMQVLQNEILDGNHAPW